MAEYFDGEIAVGPAETRPELVSDDPRVARIVEDTVVPVGDGQTLVRIKGELHKNQGVLVIVRDMNVAHEWSFQNHVEPVLARAGCSSGACHGALAGKGGFRLSLRGYDPERDYLAIVEQQHGRRIDRASPASSLLLTKPSMAVPHKGGLQLKADSRHYRILADWVAAGAPAPSRTDAVLKSLKVFPDRVTLKRSGSQPLIVQATYSDGRIEDVTYLSKFSSANEAVVAVDSDGLVSVVGPGEGAVSVWFSSRIVIARMTVPFDQPVESSDLAVAGRRNFIDDLVLNQLRQLNLSPSPRCSDETFIRRAFLDTIGTLPTSTEVRSFLADGSANKRDRLIEELLQRPEFVDYWTYRWSDLLLLNGTELRPEAIAAYYAWIRRQVDANTPWNELVRQLVTARGSSLEDGATNFFALHQSPEAMAENVSQAFLGLSIGCAKCHNHPLEKWTNDQYYAFANLFSRVRAKGWGGDPRNGDGLRTLVTSSSGELVQPRTGRPQPPTPLDGEPMDPNAAGDRREVLADWLTSPDNPLFARAISNRVWKYYYGVGLVEQVDDMRASNPASNEELLTALSQYLVDEGFKLKSLMRMILQSETWQRDSIVTQGNSGDTRHYSRCYPRRLMAEVLLDAVAQVTDVPSDFTKIVYPGADVRPTDAYPKGTRAIQLHDSAVESYFLQTFGRHQRRITCECERSDEPSVVQVLHISNGATVNDKLAAPDNRLGRWLKEFPDDHALLDEVFLTCVSRLPRPDERAELAAMLASTPSGERRLLLEDLVWGILSSREFLFNH